MWWVKMLVGAGQLREVDAGWLKWLAKVVG